MNPFAEKKQKLVSSFRQGCLERAQFALSKNSSNLFRVRPKQKAKRLDVRQFNSVLAIDKEAKTVDVEAMITYEALVQELLKHNFAPCVVPELKTITVGGALVGVGIESSSFRYGLVHETILEIEVLTGNGEVLICSKDNEHKDLFYAFPNS